MNSVNALYIGESKLKELYNIYESVELTSVTYFKEIPKKPYDVVIVDKRLDATECENLFEAAKAYCLFYTSRKSNTPKEDELFKSKSAKALEKNTLKSFLETDIRDYFGKSYGEKYSLKNITLSKNYNGQIKWNAGYALMLKGSYGDKMQQIAFWRNNIPVFKGQAIDFWLEYSKDETVELMIKFTLFKAGTVDEVINEWEFAEEDLKDIITISNEEERGSLFVSVYAKGEGRLNIVALHDRYSRRGKGHFLVGGERYVTSEREELFAYFDPGDFKPPLNVFFSGYKTQQGFEGYAMMKKFKSPFLLISEPRLEGGAFYMGKEEYENMVRNVIYKYIDKLGFKSKDVVLAGLSMGTYGALYYGCDIKPGAVVMGKPLASVGNIAENEKLFRPGGFPTSLDVLNFLQRSTTPSAVKKLNERFWNKFEKANWSNTKFIVSYMIEDDYDSDAYEKLITNIDSEGAQVYGKGLHGRHNDNTIGIVEWFYEQYKQMLLDDYGRKID
ncbi:MAG: accessory Sec system protein Asp2 [Eubacterium sp.]|nr:accessory Sec system protein Asp2 [Eubacterium sp.]